LFFNIVRLTLELTFERDVSGGRFSGGASVLEVQGQRTQVEDILISGMRNHGGKRESGKLLKAVSIVYDGPELI
jgi:acyl-coenzyme A thioesterase PaaI-like protein